MAGWPMVKLGEVLTKTGDQIDPEPSTEYSEITVKIWGKGIVERRRVLGSEVNGRRYVATGGNFILSRIDARHGAMGIVPDSLDGALVTNDFPLFSANTERLDLPFLGWLCRTRDFVELCTRASEGSTNRVRLKEERFLSLEIPLPPLAEQRRIVARIEALAAEIDEAKRLRREASEEAGALMPSRRRAAIGSSAFSETTVDEVCEAIIDNLHSNPLLSDGGIPCVRSPDVGYGSLNLTGAQRTDEAEYKRRTVRGAPRENDIVIVREGGGTGKCARVGRNQKFSLGQRVMMLRPQTSLILPSFFLHHLLSPWIQEDQIKPLSKGSASPHLNIGSLRKFRLFLPPLPEQRRIVAELDALQAEVDTLKRLQLETAAELDALLPSILDRAFKGEL